MPRGTSAVDYRAHNPKDGGSIPSPATKHGFIMIEITFTYSVKPGAPVVDINVVGAISLKVYDEMYVRVKQLINENVILNCCISMINENNQFLLKHFATTPENAQLFLNEYVDPVAWWQPHGIDFKMSLAEIDPATIDHTATIPIFDDNNVLYGLEPN